MHFHSTLFLDLYFVACTVAFLGYLIVRPSIARWRHRRVASLEELFDAGTVKLDGNLPVRGYFGYPILTGLFHGRPASISSGNPLIGFLRVRVSGHFYTPFEIRPKWPRLIDKVRRTIFPICALLYFVGVMTIPSSQVFEVSPWKVAPALIFSIFTVCLVLSLCSWLLGYDSIPKDSRGELAFADSVPLKYLTYLPDRFIPIIERPRIHDSVVRLIGGFPIYLLKSDGGIAGHNRAFRKYGLGGSVEATCVYRRRLLDRETVREILTELSTLCGSIEEADMESKSLIPVAPEPL
jgi:hypothetical protein